MLISPLTLRTVTRLGTVSPAEKFRLELVGRLCPDGYTVRKPFALAWVTVTLSTSAVSDGQVGTQPVSVLGAMTSVPPGRSGPLGAPRATRVSTIRVGPSGTKLS